MVENYKLFKITYLVCYFNVNQVKATEEEWCCCMYVAIAVISATWVQRERIIAE